jgi:hypothetical protein
MEALEQNLNGLRSEHGQQLAGIRKSMAKIEGDLAAERRLRETADERVGA